MSRFVDDRIFGRRPEASRPKRHTSSRRKPEEIIVDARDGKVYRCTTTEIRNGKILAIVPGASTLLPCHKVVFIQTLNGQCHHSKITDQLSRLNLSQDEKQNVAGAYLSVTGLIWKRWQKRTANPKASAPLASSPRLKKSQPGAPKSAALQKKLHSRQPKH